MKYEVKVLKGADLTDEIVHFLRSVMYEVALSMELPIDSDKFDFKKFADHNRLTLCFRDGEPVGIMLAALLKSFWDEDLIILKQISLWAVPKTRAANLLFKDFIDFGKLHADHIHTNIGVKTNISSRTLERIGFRHVETLYRLET